MKNRAEAALSATGWRRGDLVELAKNAPPIRKLLKIVAKSDAAGTIEARSVFARHTFRWPMAPWRMSEA